MTFNKNSQSYVISQCIEVFLDKGMRDRQQIYTKVAAELSVPRPSVRRVAGELKRKYIERAQILQPGFGENNG